MLGGNVGPKMVTLVISTTVEAKLTPAKSSKKTGMMNSRDFIFSSLRVKLMVSLCFSENK